MTEDVMGRVSQAALLLQNRLRSANPGLMCDHRHHHKTLRQCCTGRELVDCLMRCSDSVESRNQALVVWQLLMDEGLLEAVKSIGSVQDSDSQFYRFIQVPARTQGVPGSRGSVEDLQEALSLLSLHGQEVGLTAALRKPPSERTADDVEMVFEELIHIKAVSHLSHTVKRQLAAVVHFESHQTSGTVLFSQGEAGTSWYIIWKGSVSVYTHHKGLVSFLEEGDGFGELSLVNDMPRSATIVLREDGCQLLRVDKQDFNRILRDVEMNTVHLKEHGRDVLVLEKDSQTPRNTTAASVPKYTVMYGTGERILEYLLDKLVLDSGSDNLSESLLEDFLLTHCIFMPTTRLQEALINHARAEPPGELELERNSYSERRKKGVLQFVARWVTFLGNRLRDESSFPAFLEELEILLAKDSRQDDVHQGVRKMVKRSSEMILNTPQIKLRNCLNWMRSVRNSGNTQHLSANTKILYNFYRPDHSQIRLLQPVGSSVQDLISALEGQKGSGSPDNHVLVRLRSSGDRTELSPTERSVYTSLELNDRLYYCTREEIKALVPEREQLCPKLEPMSVLESIGSRQLAALITDIDWELFNCVHEVELILHSLSSEPEAGSTVANLQSYLRRFNLTQFWVVSELCMCTDLDRRTALLKKFIKVSACCKDLKNMNTFFAIMFGLSHGAVRRLSQTWEGLPGKILRTFQEQERLLDPSRNHRVYRLAVNKLSPPLLPFMPLLIKDMTFIQEGNETLVNSLVNFEKMRMSSQVARILRDCRHNYKSPIPGQKSIPTSHLLDSPDKSSSRVSDRSQQDEMSVRRHIQDLKAIDSQQILFQMSRELEP